MDIPKDKLVLILFCMLIPLFLLLLSYKVVLAVSSVTAQQGVWMNYFYYNATMPGNYTALERSHMQDVKSVLLGAKLLFEVLFFVMAILLWYLIQQQKWQDAVYYGGLATLILVGFILLGLLINFNLVFTLFHSLFFPQGNWQFAADSLLIQTFPLDYFISISLRIFGLTLGLAIAMVVVGKAACKRK